MATGYSLPPPTALEIHDPQAADKWKTFRWAWTNYSLLTELTVKTEAIQVKTLLTVEDNEPTCLMIGNDRRSCIGNGRRCMLNHLMCMLQHYFCSLLFFI